MCPCRRSESPRVCATWLPSRFEKEPATRSNRLGPAARPGESAATTAVGPTHPTRPLGLQRQHQPSRAPHQPRAPTTAMGSRTPLGPRAATTARQPQTTADSAACSNHPPQPSNRPATPSFSRPRQRPTTTDVAGRAHTPPDPRGSNHSTSAAVHRTIPEQQPQQQVSHRPCDPVASNHRFSPGRRGDGCLQQPYLSAVGPPSHPSLGLFCSMCRLVRRGAALRSDAAGDLRQWLLAAAADLQRRCGWAGLWLGEMVRSVTTVAVA